MNLQFRIPQDIILNSNQRLHFHETAHRTRHLRSLARFTMQGRPGLPLATKNAPIGVTVTITPPTRRRFDPPNLYPTVKALIDGMTDAGAWEDDSYQYIHSLTFKYGDEERIPKHYIVKITTHTAV